MVITRSMTAKASTLQRAMDPPIPPADGHAATPASRAASRVNRAMDPSLPPADGHCPFEALPKELRDMIYDYAYVDDKPLKVLLKSRWDQSEVRRHHVEKRRFVPSTFGPCHLERFMVSRSWFVGASTYFYKNTQFAFDGLQDEHTDFLNADASGYTLDSLSGTPHDYRLVSVPARTLVASVSVVSSSYRYSTETFVQAIEKCRPGLRNLHVRLEYGFFEESLEKHIEQEEWTKENFQEYKASRDLLEACGHIKLTVEAVPRCEGYSWGNELGMVFKRNIEILASQLRTEAASPQLTLSPRDTTTEAMAKEDPARSPHSGATTIAPDHVIVANKSSLAASGDASPQYRLGQPKTKPKVWSNGNNWPSHDSETSPHIRSPAQAPGSPVLTSPVFNSSTSLRHQPSIVQSGAPAGHSRRVRRSGGSESGLGDKDMPRTKEDFARLVFERGPDVFEWVQNALHRLEE